MEGTGGNTHSGVPKTLLIIKRFGRWFWQYKQLTPTLFFCESENVLTHLSPDAVPDSLRSNPQMVEIFFTIFFGYGDASDYPLVIDNFKAEVFGKIVRIDF